jgi:peroxiredoxin
MRTFSRLLLLTLGLFLFAACSKEDSAPAGQPLAADFTLRDLDGKLHKLSDYRGKVVFLNFWATWCPPCREEIPSMERLNEVLGSKDFVMLAINTDENIKDLESFVKEHPHNFTVLSDADGKIQQLYKVIKFPETFVIDRQGRIVEHIVGARDWSSTSALKFFNAQIVGGK